ncbi:TetR/AcrR family transcriptional regulator [Mycobacterium sp. SMC-4]|uniref:TetR/AcrR family transcriptional regulator n=1 Tax=Mycobacterium sp. SMC-4 TaxID=2857059 RepID=UPI0021B3951D|nr:TetR/AcrR family transcriptional regulator [Mycobacterium sp. SMC-4]UXA18467.1 TetR/AcrR family transcriptional regulator [Mycobacterium sp. SMC-4]
MGARTDARQRWLDAGIQMLAGEGAEAVRIDRISARLKLSKGSFHHHFDGAAAYKRELLAYYEKMATDGLEHAIDDASATGDVHATLTRLTQFVVPDRPGLYQPELEVAVRAWATWDRDVQAVQARIDRARLAALQRVWRPFVGTDGEARLAALLPYLVAVGAAVVVPPIDANELRGVFELLLPLVPGLAGGASAPGG